MADTVVTQFRNSQTHEPVEAPQVYTPKKPTWESYDDELSTEIRDPKLRAAVKEYESRPQHERTELMTQECLAQLVEENKNAVKEFKFYKQDELINEKTRMGQIMQDLDFLKKVNHLVPAKFVAGKFRTRARGVSLTGYNEFYIVGIAVWENRTDGAGWKVVCQVQPGLMPEFSILRLDAHDIPVNQKYIGWRTILMRMIMNGVITEQQAENEFGPATGVAARRFNETMWEWRNRPRLDNNIPS